MKIRLGIILLTQVVFCYGMSNSHTLALHNHTKARVRSKVNSNLPIYEDNRVKLKCKLLKSMSSCHRALPLACAVLLAATIVLPSAEARVFSGFDSQGGRYTGGAERPYYENKSDRRDDKPEPSRQSGRKPSC